MTEAASAGKTRAADQWRERIAEQQCSGVSIKQFCKEHGLAEHSFYFWRRKLRTPEAVRFALVDRGLRPEAQTDVCIELILPGGERLRIAAGVDAVTLRRVLEALRA
jgi:transposase-like protein